MPVLSVQLKLLFITLGTGFILGIVFDFYRVFTGFIKIKGILLSLGDLLFWLFLSGFFFAVLLWANEGEMRFHSLLALFLGYVLYRRSLGPFIYSFFDSILGFFSSCAVKIKNALIKSINCGTNMCMKIKSSTASSFKTVMDFIMKIRKR